jgi:hypothetical protein
MICLLPLSRIIQPNNKDFNSQTTEKKLATIENAIQKRQ